MPKLLDMDITALRSTSHVMCCIKIFGYSESGSDSEKGSKSSSGSDEDEDESKSESEASTKTGTYFVSKWCCVLSFVVLSQWCMWNNTQQICILSVLHICFL